MRENVSERVIFSGVLDCFFIVCVVFCYKLGGKGGGDRYYQHQEGRKGVGLEGSIRVFVTTVRARR